MTGWSEDMKARAELNLSRLYLSDAVESARHEDLDDVKEKS